MTWLLHFPCVAFSSGTHCCLRVWEGSTSPIKLPRAGAFGSLTMPSLESALGGPMWTPITQVTLPRLIGVKHATIFDDGQLQLTDKSLSPSRISYSQYKVKRPAWLAYKSCREHQV